MPNLDGTGPFGNAPFSGRKRGICRGRLTQEISEESNEKTNPKQADISDSQLNQYDYGYRRRQGGGLGNGFMHRHRGGRG